MGYFYFCSKIYIINIKKTELKYFYSYVCLMYYITGLYISRSVYLFSRLFHYEFSLIRLVTGSNGLTKQGNVSVSNYYINVSRTKLIQL